MGAEQSSFEQGDALRVGKHTHYAILGLDANNFDEKALKKHYRALALKWHPDRNIGNESVAAEKFKSVQEAFDTLSDPTKRAAYDQAVLAKKHGGSERDRDPNSRSAHRAAATGGAGASSNSTTTRLAAAWAFVCVLAARGHGYPCGNRHAAAGWTACT